MKTSKIKIRPFIPCMKDEVKDGREPFAVLKYGNIEIEFDYTIIRHLKLDMLSDCYTKTVSLASAGIDEILKEMDLDLYGRMPDYHRDSDKAKRLPMTHNHLHPFNNRNVEVEK